MTEIQELEIEGNIQQQEFESMASFMFNSLAVHRVYKNSAILEKKEELLEELISFFNKYLALKFTGSLKHKLEIISFIEKLTIQKELIELQTGKLNINNIKAAAKRMEKKSQSAFGPVK